MSDAPLTLPHERPLSQSDAEAMAGRVASFVPTLTTSRLTLRAPTVADFSVYAEIALSPRGRFLLTEQTRDNAWFDFVNMVACWLLRGHGLWTVEKTDSGETAGFVLIGFEPGDHEPELGFFLAADSEGLGYATEAAGEAKRFAFEELRFSTLVSTIDHDNPASQRVAERIGGVRDPRAEAAHDNKIMVFRYSAVE